MSLPTKMAPNELWKPSNDLVFGIPDVPRKKMAPQSSTIYSDQRPPMGLWTPYKPFPRSLQQEVDICTMDLLHLKCQRCVHQNGSVQFDLRRISTQVVKL